MRPGVPATRNARSRVMGRPWGARVIYTLRLRLVLEELVDELEVGLSTIHPILGSTVSQRVQRHVRPTKMVAPGIRMQICKGCAASQERKRDYASARPPLVFFPH